MRRCLVLLLLIALLSVPLFAAGTVTLSTEQQNVPGVFPYSIAWTSDASGVVSADATGNTLSVVEGRIAQVRIVPAAAGTQPSDLYDVTLVDSRGIDVLNGTGANQSNALGMYVLFNPPLLITTTTTLDVVVANAGNAKSGTLTVWVTR